MNSNYLWLLIVCLTSQWIINIQCYPNDVIPTPMNSHLQRLLVRRQACPNANMCLSQWGYCGYGSAYCGQGCRAGPCTGITTTTTRTTTRTTIRTTATSPTTSGSTPSSCSDPNACLSQYGYCGYTTEYCGQGCKGGPCTSTGGTGGSTNGYVITDENFACAFNNLDAQTRGQRLDGLRRSGYKPGNADEAAVFLGHVYHETDGLKTLTEYCAPGKSHSYTCSRVNRFIC